MSEITFSPYNEAYAKAIADIYNYYVINTTVTFHTQIVTPKDINTQFGKGCLYDAFVIKADDEIVGYAICAPYINRQAYSKTGEINIFIKLEYTNMGIGAKAIAYLEKLSRDKGLHVLVVIISGENTISIKSLKRYGYVKCGHIREAGIKFERYIDSVILQKIL